MKYLILALLTISYFSVFSQKAVTVYTEPSDFQHRIYAGSQFPLRVHAGYELQYKRLQIGGFVGVTPQRYQNLVFEFLQKIKNQYQSELGYLRDVAKPKMQFGGEIKLDIGKNISIGATAQTFNVNLIDTPQKLTQGILPEQAKDIENLINESATRFPDIKTFYENKQVEAFMNTIVGGPVIEKLIWLDKNETFFLKAKFAYWIVLKRENDLVSQDYTSLEQLGIESFKPRFLAKLEKISSQLQAPSFGLELGFAF
jgi:hypothetical protein